MKMLVHVDNEDITIWPIGAICIEIWDDYSENLTSFDFNQIWPSSLFQ